MKTSVIEVHDMLSVLTVDEVEKRFGEVPGIESATVNYAAGNATVRYDETLLNVADIKVLVHQRGKQPAGDGPQDKVVPDAPPSAAAAAEPKPSQDAPVDAPTPAASAGGGKSDQAPPSTPPSTFVVAEPKPPTGASAATPASTPAASPADEHRDHEESGALGKVTAWVRDTFAGEDKGKVEPGAQTSTPAADAPKAAPGASAAEPEPAPATPAAGGHKGHAASGTQPSTPVDAESKAPPPDTTIMPTWRQILGNASGSRWP
ncbi:MAG: heavy-metal-associated domain-containing protein [Porticoccaceae bacterium]